MTRRKQTTKSEDDLSGSVVWGNFSTLRKGEQMLSVFNAATAAVTSTDDGDDEKEEEENGDRWF